MRPIAPARVHAPARLHDWRHLRTPDGGAREGAADLWATYAAVRTLRWLGSAPADPDAAAEFLVLRRNRDGGFAWQRGLRSDVWATYYCTQALADLGAEPDGLVRLRSWLESLRTPAGGLAMSPGQDPDVWSTYYGVRTWTEVAGRTPPAARAVLRWLGELQLPEGGAAWSPGAKAADVRAAYYAAVARDRLVRRGVRGRGPDPDRLARWLRRQQAPEGGFRFRDDAEGPCLWATFRASAALRVLGSSPVDVRRLVRWVSGRRRPDGGFARWAWYDTSDVWACFSAVGTLRAVEVRLPERERRALVGFLRGCQLPGSGFAYRAPTEASDALATAALAFLVQLDGELDRSAREAAARELTDWLARAQMPPEGGVMYMPGRGAEVRCTLWAASAARLAGVDALDRPRVATWLRQLQNPDGGFGYWEGRGSDITATTAALETLAVLDLPLATIDGDAALAFVRSCMAPEGIRHGPRGAITLATTCQGARALELLGDRAGARAAVRHLDDCRSALGGYAARPRSAPDLGSTYQAVLTLQCLSLPWPRQAVARLLRRLARPQGGLAWSPLSREGGGPLPTALVALLGAAIAEPPSSVDLPRLCL